MKRCKLRRVGDQISCTTCNLIWDTNDREPRMCGANIKPKNDTLIDDRHQHLPVTNPTVRNDAIKQINKVLKK